MYPTWDNKYILFWKLAISYLYAIYDWIKLESSRAFAKKLCISFSTSDFMSAFLKKITTHKTQVEKLLMMFRFLN